MLMTALAPSEGSAQFFFDYRYSNERPRSGRAVQQQSQWFWPWQQQWQQYQQPAPRRTPRPAPPPPPAAAPPPAAPAPEAELPELTGPLAVRLLDADNKNALLDTKTVRVAMAAPRDYTQVTGATFIPPSAQSVGAEGNRSRL